MNNVKTRFVMDISQKLSAAPDSPAKVDLVEELSENLYGRYTDLVDAGTPEEEAYRTALDKLGDVNELLAYLDCCGEQSTGSEDQSGQGGSEDWFDSLVKLGQQSIDQAREAISAAQEAARRFSSGTNVHRDSGRVSNGELEFPSRELRGISINFAGDLTVYLDGDPEAPVRLQGDVADLGAVVGAGGVLNITQDRSAGGNFFFSRGLTADSMELSIPQRHWEKLDITTASGDIEICDGVLEADTMCLVSAIGDMELDSLNVRRLEVTTTSGDVSLSDCVCDELLFHSASGDLDGDNISAAILAQTASGDMSLSGDIRALKADSASGDLDLESTILPESLELSTKSGDCEVCIPDCDGFVFRLHTVSGDLDSDFPMTVSGPRRPGTVEGTYKNGGDGRVFNISSVSGDIELRSR